MKSLLIAAAFGLGLLGAGVAAPGTALASGQHGHRVYGGLPAYNFFGVWLYGSPHHIYRGHRHSFRDYDHRKPRHFKRHDYRKRYTHNPRWRHNRQGRINGR